jgi:hypothetical protein
MIVFFISVGVIVGTTIWYNSYTSKVNTSKLKKIEDQAEEALKKELLNPLNYVEIKTKSGLKFQTNPFEPYYKIEEDFNISHFRIERVYYYIMKSSKDQAKKAIKKWIESDQFFDDSTDTYIPMCEIEYFQILNSETKECL